MRRKTMPTGPALRRIYAAGLTLREAVTMSDGALLRHPTIGRKTLRFIQALRTVEASI
jgi:hypothetical protein